MALVLILLAYAKIILEEDECQTEDKDQTQQGWYAVRWSFLLGNPCGYLIETCQISISAHSTPSSSINIVFSGTLLTLDT